MENEMKVYSTYNYGMFEIVKGNRKVNDLHVERLKKSMEEDYLVSPIIINEKNQIIDGQHRFNAIKDLNKKVYYIICEGYGLDEIHRLNEINKTWNKKDFLVGYADKGLEEYIEVRNFMEEYGVSSVSMAIELLNDNLSQKSRNKRFENGKFEIETYDLAVEIMKGIKDFDEYFDSARTSLFVKAFKKLYRFDKYNHQKMISKLKKNGHKLDTRASVGQYLKLLLNEIYNPNLKTENKIYVVSGSKLLSA